MYPLITNNRFIGRARTVVLSAGLTATVMLGACGSSNSSSSSTSTTSPAPSTSVSVGADSSPDPTNGSSSGNAVLPVEANPISNPATAKLLKVDSVLVENNVNPATGKAADDHLEIAITNTGTTELAGFEIFYTFIDPTAAVTENYYAKLPADFTIPAGGHRIAHFDNSGAPDHFPVSNFSLYKTSANALDVTVIVSATGAAPTTATAKKDAGGSETAD
jgi:hypothetical protein